MKKPEPIALFDLDGTLADYEGALLKELNLMAAPGEELEEIPDNAPYHIERRMKLIKGQRGWWESLPVIPSGIAVMEEAHELGFKIQVLTKGPNVSTNAWTEKFNWCKMNLAEFSVGVTITQDKGLVYGKVLVDDYPDYMLRWLEWRPRGLGIMPARKWNENFQHPNVIRFDYSEESFNLVRRRLQGAYERE